MVLAACLGCTSPETNSPQPVPDYFFNRQENNQNNQKNPPAPFPHSTKTKPQSIDDLIGFEQADPVFGSAASGPLSNFLQNRQWDQVINEAERILETNPDDRNAHCALAVAYSQQERLIDSVRELDQLTRLHPDFETAYIYISEIASQVSKQALEEKRYFDGIRALSLFKDMVSSKRGRTIFQSWIESICFSAGRRYYQEKNFKEAQRYLSAIAPDLKTNFDLWRKLGLSYIHTENFSKAVPVFEHLTEQDNNPIDLPLKLYSRALAASEEKEKIGFLEEAIAHWPEYKLDLLEKSVEEVMDHYLFGKQKEPLKKLVRKYMPESNRQDLKKCTIIHAQFFRSLNQFFLYTDQDKDSYVCYFNTMFDYFREKNDFVHAARCLYGLYWADQDEEKFKRNYQSLGDHLIPFKKAKRVLGKFFEVK